MSAPIRCVTCGQTRVEFAPGTAERLIPVAMVKAGWRRVVGGWRCPECIRKEEAK